MEISIHSIIVFVSLEADQSCIHLQGGRCLCLVLTHSPILQFILLTVTLFIVIIMMRIINSTFFFHVSLVNKWIHNYQSQNELQCRYHCCYLLLLVIIIYVVSGIFVCGDITVGKTMDIFEIIFQFPFTFWYLTRVSEYCCWFTDLLTGCSFLKNIDFPFSSSLPPPPYTQAL